MPVALVKFFSCIKSLMSVFSFFSAAGSVVAAGGLLVAAAKENTREASKSAMTKGIFMRESKCRIARLSSLRKQRRRAAHLSVAQTGQCLVRLREREFLHRRAHRHTWREREKLFAIAAREVGHRAKRPLVPEDFIRKCRHIAHVNPAADDDAALAHGP